MTEKGRDICSINGITVSVIDGITVSAIDGITVSAIDGITVSAIDGITVSAIDGITVREIMSGITKFQNQECIKMCMNNTLNSELDVKISNKFQFRIHHIL